MTALAAAGRACAVEPLRLGPSIGAALALLGVPGCVPLLHGAQGCAATAGALLARHFRRALPLRSVALNEVSAALGGWREVDEALLAIHREEAPPLIGVVTGGLAELRGDDLAADLAAFRRRHQSAYPGLTAIGLVAVAAADFAGGLQDGWGGAVVSLIDAFARPGPTVRRQVTVLPGSHLTPGDVEELKGLIAAFGLAAVVLPDLSETREVNGLDRLSALGRSVLTIAIGEQMRPAAEALHRRAGTPFQVLDGLTGLTATDRLVGLLGELGEGGVPLALRRQREQLIDAMIDGHDCFTGRPVVVAGEPDLVFVLAGWLDEMGAGPVTAVAGTRAAILRRLPAGRCVVGDLDDLERAMAGAGLAMAPSAARHAAARLGVPLWRCGLPVTDRLDAPFRVSIGYRGTRNLLFDLAALLSEDAPSAMP